MRYIIGLVLLFGSAFPAQAEYDFSKICSVPQINESVIKNAIWSEVGRSTAKFLTKKFDLAEDALNNLDSLVEFVGSANKAGKIPGEFGNELYEMLTRPYEIKDTADTIVLDTVGSFGGRFRFLCSIDIKFNPDAITAYMLASGDINEHNAGDTVNIVNFMLTQDWQIISYLETDNPADTSGKGVTPHYWHGAVITR